MNSSLGSDEEVIRELDRQWGEAATKQELEAVVGFYAADASLVWPGQKAVKGIRNIRANWTMMLKRYKRLRLKFTPKRIDISGDLASDFGDVLQAYDKKSGRVQVKSKYLVVWKKVDGNWKVLYDSYNSNGK